MSTLTQKGALFAVGCFFALAGTATALPINDTLSYGGASTFGSIPSGGVNDLIGPGNTLEGYYGAQLYLDKDAKVTFEYLGKEAGYNNLFEVYYDGDWQNIFSTDMSAVGSSQTFVFDAGLLDFRFQANAGAAGMVTNGANPDFLSGGVTPNFFLSFNELVVELPGGMLGSLDPGVYLWLDDGGAGPDDNHDDMLIKVSAAPVPEPATMLLFGAGLAGLAGFKRRKE